MCVCDLALTCHFPCTLLSAFVGNSWMEEVSGTMLEGVKELEVCLPVKEVEEVGQKGKVEG